MAVIGAGWAGCAAAATLCRQGHHVTLIEASRHLGGRARAVDIQEKKIDNGQHILLGAYSACLELMRFVKIDLRSALLRLPLQMVYPKQTGIEFCTAKLPAPLHLFSALLTSKGLSRADKMALARFSTTARWIDWKLNHNCTVSELLQRYEQTENLCCHIWNPLCIAALNTPPERASAQVFLNVLRDSLGAKRAASDMLIPRFDLSRLLPEACANLVRECGGEVVLGVSIQSITAHSSNQCSLVPLHVEQTDGQAQIADQRFDGVIIATGAEQAKRLFSSALSADQIGSDTQATSVKSILDTTFQYEAITTCYLQYAASCRLDRPFYALADNPNQHAWAQFIFDRGQLDTHQAGLMAVVISASAAAIAQPSSELIKAVCDQLAQQLQSEELKRPIWSQVITEKRATFACSPNLLRPTNRTEITNIMLAGDYTASDYPATLESAVRSGILAAQAFK
ncbi:hydroxysqualene dehydroxylase HpnE [Undibacterium sp. BYS107W]|uniref:Hydroxysqualene dehydroxylase HpnE n=1 Tax=Undibacterium baiyunense TaxID=2828731 RepID=A0A941I302_9BURK|nr:hydroxysqualene dehydroxylase HpnE [Undibacterium baiyunense]